MAALGACGHLLLRRADVPAAGQLRADDDSLRAVALILGYGGIITLGHSAYFGTGAYVAGIFAARVTASRSPACSRACWVPDCWAGDRDRHPAHTRPRS
jgi:hypothetical protein